ncbi:MAG: hypothetical protein HKO71_04110 [Pseudomonadales bacterium]|nr:hypothetical protein [Pseudomonadales bacterium]
MASPVTAHSIVAFNVTAPNVAAQNITAHYRAGSASAAGGSRNTAGFANDWLDQVLHKTRRHSSPSHERNPETGAGEPSPTDIIAPAGPLPLWLAKRGEPSQQPAKAPARRKSQR